MKRKFKKLLIGAIVLLTLFTLFIIAWVFFLFPYFEPNKAEIKETKVGVAKIAEESEVIDFNETNGVAYINNEVVVYIRESASKEQIDHFFHQYDAEIDTSMADISLYKLIFDSAMTYEELELLLKDMQSNPIVENAYLNTVSEFEQDTVDIEDDFEYQNAVYPVDHWNGDTWNVSVPRGENWGMEAINAPGAWGYLKQMSRVKIGLIDSMPDTAHKDLKVADYKILFIDENTGKTNINKYTVTAGDHGTHVSGTMNAEWNNKNGVAGIMGGKGELYYSTVLYDLNGKISERYATAYSYLLALKALIDQDVQVINISQNTSRLIGFAASRGNRNAINYLSQQAELTEKGLSRIISSRKEAGKPDFVICVAAGNSNHIYYYKDNKATYGYREKMTIWERIKYLFGWRGEIGDSLALYNNFLNLMDADEVRNRVIVVGAIGIDSNNSTANNTKYSYSYFSNVGSRVDVVAPGYDVYSCVANGYDLMNGTSMATPHVSGVAGLIFACNPSLTGIEVKEIIKASTVGRYYYTGGYSGLINAETAVINALKAREQAVERVLKTETDSGLDLCFVVDTTGSMGDDIDNAKENMEDILVHLVEKTENYRVALIDYRDYPSRSGESSDYPYQVQLYFTNNNASIVNAINTLDLGDGGDTKETVYSALIAASELEWRNDAKKVIIILGDAAPLDPEPVTEYSYDDVLVTLFNADISLDYEESDKRVVDALDTSFINVFSIGTNASSDAADFFEEISQSTGGSYASVDNASKVSDAIIDSIEQIEIVEKFTVNLDFGEELANEKIFLYSETDFMFAIETDDEGKFVIDAIEEDTYKWTSNSLYAEGTVSVEKNERDVSARITHTYWFTTILRFWQQNRMLVLLALSILLAICVLVPVAVFKVNKKIRTRKLSLGESQTKQNESLDRVLYCPNCGEKIENGAKFCGKCGQGLADN